MERNGMEPIGARVDSKLLAFHFKPLFTQKFCSCSYTHCCINCLSVNNNAILQDTCDVLFNAHRHIVIKSLHQGLIAIERHKNSKFLK